MTEGGSATGPIDGLWGITLLVGTGMLLVLGFGFVLLTGSHASPGVPICCPVNGHLALAQHIAGEGSHVTDVVTCGAFPHGQPVACGLPCLAGRVRPRLSERLEDLLAV